MKWSIGRSSRRGPVATETPGGGLTAKSTTRPRKNPPRRGDDRSAAGYGGERHDSPASQVGYGVMSSTVPAAPQAPPVIELMNTNAFALVKSVVIST